MNLSGDIGVLTTDVSLVVQSWDQWLAGVTGITPGDARGRPLTELIPAVETYRLMERFRQTIGSGVVHVFSPALHGPMIRCAPGVPSRYFEQMQQRVTVGPLLDGTRIAGLVITVQDVTSQLDAERDLAGALMSDDADQRRAAAEAIASAPRLESLDSFSPALRSDDWRVRRAAVTALAAAADQDLLRAVLVTLRREHRDFSSLSSTLKLLAVTDQDITEPLTELLHDPDVDLRIQAALALGEQAHPAAAQALLGALDDADGNVRFHAIEALGRLRAGNAVDQLLAIAESSDFFLGFAALESLAAIADPKAAPRLVPLLANEAFREPAARALSELGDERVIAPLVATLNASPEAAHPVIQALASIAGRLAREDLDVSALFHASLDDAGRRHLLEAARRAPDEAGPGVARVLGWIGGTESSEVLGAMLSNPKVRSEAAAVLIRIGDPAIDVLIERLDDEDDEVRGAAIAALGEIGSRRATPHLVTQLEDPRTVIAAIGALARIADPEAFEPLLALVGHRDHAVRTAAVGALNAIGHPQLPERVLQLLGDEDPRVRESAVRIAGYFGYPAATKMVLERATDVDEGVRVAALEQLPLLDETEALEALAAAVSAGTPKARAAAVRALGRVEAAAALPLIVGALQDEDAWVRYFAARAIGDRPEQTDVPALLSLVESDPSEPVRIAAVEAIGRRRVPVDVAPLVRAAEGDNVDLAAAALVALGRLGGSEAIGALRAAARSPGASRRRAAIEGLAAAASSEAVAELEWMAATESDPAVIESVIGRIADLASGSGEEARHAISALLALLAEPDRSDLATAAIARLPVRMVPALAAGLRHVQELVRRRTVQALARYRHPEATKLLALAFEDADASVRETAAAEVMRLGTRLFDGILRQLEAEDPSDDVRRAAAAALSPARATD